MMYLGDGGDIHYPEEQPSARGRAKPVAARGPFPCRLWMIRSPRLAKMSEASCGIATHGTLNIQTNQPVDWEGAVTQLLKSRPSDLLHVR